MTRQETRCALKMERAPLLAALSGLAKVVERRNTIPILSHVRLSAGRDGLTLAATDLDVAMTATVPAEVAGAFDTTVPAQLLHDIVRRLPEGAQAGLEHDGAALKLVAGRSRFTLQTLPAEDFPDLAAGDFPHRLELPAAAFARLIARVEFAISTEETRYYLNGVYVHAVDGELRACATDGHRLARQTLPGVAPPEGFPGIIVPRKAVAELRRLAEGLKDGTLVLEVSPQKIRATAGNTVLVSKLIDGTFPDYPRVIPDNPHVLEAETASLAAAVDRVATISSERGRAVRLDIGEGRVALATRNPDQGEASEDVEVAWEAPPLAIGFNAAYLVEILKLIAAPRCRLRLDSPGSPAVFDVEHGLYVLMPMRV
ncbi:MAG TPA: DNA polymerase III subunit beta [Beijerinckiaceae bacterium]|nr:DNA polymerase III subunit beta [Beijerinckiaceae bacterium]